jgi:protein-S-isoprenylcysteine O-methyltransferase Ste14
VSLFGSAGRLSWLNAWILLAINFAAGAAAMVLLWSNPELLAERSNTKAGKSWDKPIVFVVVLLGPVAIWVTAGLDERFHASRSMGLLALVAGIAAALPAAGLVAWAMRANRFFSSVVRIQKDRGHAVVTDGPYRFVRHPGYTGMALFTLVTPLILDSRWAFLPAIVTIAVWVLRTALEDRTLRSELDGYDTYAQRVRYRLLPLLW